MPANSASITRQCSTAASEVQGFWFSKARTSTAMNLNWVPGVQWQLLTLLNPEPSTSSRLPHCILGPSKPTTGLPRTRPPVNKSVLRLRQQYIGATSQLHASTLTHAQAQCRRPFAVQLHSQSAPLPGNAPSKLKRPVLDIRLPVLESVNRHPMPKHNPAAL